MIYIIDISLAISYSNSTTLFRYQIVSVLLKDHNLNIKTYMYACVHILKHTL